MTIKDVATDVLAESLFAVQDLRRKYKGEPMVTAYRPTTTDGLLYEYCPLCLFQLVQSGYYPWDRDRGEIDECLCPWYWMEGHGCEEFVSVEGEDQVTYDDFPVPDRLSRIDRWEEAIKAELAAREAKP
jgi:hypothetical protein